MNLTDRAFRRELALAVITEHFQRTPRHRERAWLKAVLHRRLARMGRRW